MLVVWLREIDQEHTLASCHIRIRDLFLVTTLRYAASDNFDYLRGCLTLLPSVFSWAPGISYSFGIITHQCTHYYV